MNQGLTIKELLFSLLGAVVGVWIMVVSVYTLQFLLT